MGGLGLAVKRLTETQEILLQFVRGRINEGTPPSRREICQRFGWTSPTSAEEALRALEKKGFLIVGRDKARSLKIVEVPDVFRDAALWEIWPTLTKVTKSLDGNH